LNSWAHFHTPTPAATWSQDVFGNAVGVVIFATMADMVVIDSVADNSVHIHGIHVPVEEPSTASVADIPPFTR
jgi:hypothetical protein